MLDRKYRRCNWEDTEFKGMKLKTETTDLRSCVYLLFRHSACQPEDCRCKHKFQGRRKPRSGWRLPVRLEIECAGNKVGECTHSARLCRCIRYRADVRRRRQSLVFRGGGNVWSVLLINPRYVFVLRPLEKVTKQAVFITNMRRPIKRVEDN